MLFDTTAGTRNVLHITLQDQKHIYHETVVPVNN